MKPKFFKKLNRGLLLSALLVVGMITYIAVDTAAFQADVKEIEQTIRGYVEQSPQMAILPSPYNKIGSEADTRTVQGKMAENEALLREYWSFSTDKKGYNQSQVMLSQIQQTVEYNAMGKGMITSAKGIVQYIHSVQKLGYHRAEVTFSYTGSIKYAGDVQWVLFGTNLQSNQTAHSPRASESAERKITPSGDVTAILVKIGDNWKIDTVELSTVSVN